MQAHKHIDESRAKQNSLRPGDWRVLAEQASKEADPHKLISLLVELNRVLDEQRRKRFTSW
jgi:hypothetical protein